MMQASLPEEKRPRSSYAVKALLLTAEASSAANTNVSARIEGDGLNV